MQVGNLGLSAVIAALLDQPSPRGATQLVAGKFQKFAEACGQGGRRFDQDAPSWYGLACLNRLHCVAVTCSNFLGPTSKKADSVENQPFFDVLARPARFERTTPAFGVNNF